MSKILELVLAGTTPQFDSDTSLATTAFTQRALGNLAGAQIINANTTLTLADAGKYLALTASPWVITLPDPTNAPAGMMYTFAANSTFSLSASAGKTIASPTGNASTATMAGMCSVVWRGDVWQVVIGGDPAWPQATGWFKMPSGVIVQWGSISAIPAGSNGSANFQTPFPTAAWVAFSQFVNTGGDASAANQFAQVRGLTTSTITLRNLSSTACSYFWCAIGN